MSRHLLKNLTSLGKTLSLLILCSKIFPSCPNGSIRPPILCRRADEFFKKLYSTVTTYSNQNIALGLVVASHMTSFNQILDYTIS